MLDELDGLADLAPLHNPVAVETIRASLVALPGVPEAAAFDTAFHATLPPAEFMYPLPDAWVSAHGLRRFGFHGLSVEWAVTRAAELLDAADGPTWARRRPPRQRLLGDRGRRRPVGLDRRWA